MCGCLGTRASFKINLYRLKKVVTFLLMTTNQFTITAEVSAEKNYLAKVTGLDSRFGHAVTFLAADRKVGKKVAYYTINEAGIYKHAPRTLTLANSRRDTGFVKVSEEGEVTEITAEEVTATFSLSQVTHSPLPHSFGARSAWAQTHNGGVGFCGARGCGRSGCEDCKD